MANSTLFNQTLTGQGTKYLSFSIKPPPGGFPQGNYQASLSANGQELASLPFTVQNLSATPGGPIISKFTAIPDTVAAGQPVTLTWDTQQRHQGHADRSRHAAHFRGPHHHPDDAKRPMRMRMALVKAPFSWPKSSLSRSSLGMAAQFTGTKGFSRR